MRLRGAVLGALTGAALGARRAVTLARRLCRAVGRADRTRTLALERQALRRLGVLAGSAPPEQLFAAMAEELARMVDPGVADTTTGMAAVCRYEPDESLTVLAAWGGSGIPVPLGTRWPLEGDSANARVYRTGRAARIDGLLPGDGPIGQRSRSIGARSSVAVPIVVDGALWGAATVMSTRPEPLPPDTEARLGDFAELAATAISSAQRREQVRRLAEEQAALRRVATIVAHGAEPREVCDAVVSEVGVLSGAARASLIRYDSPDTFVVEAYWSSRGTAEPVGIRWPLGEATLARRMMRTGRPGRLDSWGDVPGAVAARMRDLGVRSSVGCPVFAEGDLWGALAVHYAADPGPDPDTERRVKDFAELVATAISNAAARGEVRRLLDEQAALRTVATLVAREVALPEVFATAAEQMGRAFDVDDVRVLRHDGDGTAMVVASWGALADRFPVGLRWPVVTTHVLETVLRTGRPARFDGYQGADTALASAVRSLGIRSTLGAPILVGGRVWGAVVLGSAQPGTLPLEIHERMREHIDLIATAIANARARADLAASRVRIVTATDEARRRVERDLHDGAQQRLVSLALELRLAGSMGRAELDAVCDELDAAIADLRELSRGIHPAILSEGGLGPALRSVVRRAAVPTSLRLHLGSARLDPRIEVAAYYVVSEALVNVVKHAAAEGVDVTVTADECALSISVADDGTGGADPALGSGLVGIVDRVEALGGSLTIVSPPGAGTRLEARLPLALRSDLPRHGTSGATPA